MEIELLGQENSLIHLGRKGGAKIKSHKSKKPSITGKRNVETNIYCNGCKMITGNAKELNYRFVKNGSTCVADTICSVCFCKKSSFMSQP